MANGLEIILSDPDVGSVFVNVFGGITAGDEVANGIVQAFALLDSRGDEITHPLVVRLYGNNAEVGRRILTDALNGPINAATQWLERSLDDSANRRLVLPDAFLACDAILGLAGTLAQK